MIKQGFGQGTGGKNLTSKKTGVYFPYDSYHQQKPKHAKNGHTLVRLLVYAY